MKELPVLSEKAFEDWLEVVFQPNPDPKYVPSWFCVQCGASLIDTKNECCIGLLKELKTFAAEKMGK